MVDQGIRCNPLSVPEPQASDFRSQDWVPILDKVFGQKWCGEAWSSKKLEGGVSTETAGSGRISAVVLPLSLEPRPSSPQQDPRWTPLEDMEVFSPDEDETAQVATAIASATPATMATADPGPAHSPKARRSSASMLHRLLTLPSQLLEEEDADDSEMESIAVSMVTEAAAGATVTARNLTSPAATRDEEEEDDEEEEEERRKKKRRRVWTECEDCGRRFSRVSLLKAHRQTHISESSPTRNDNPAASLRCDECGKRFSSNTRLQSHLRTNHGQEQA
ncbi:uncharacterized protein [Eucyclogobius newberryi]|uniref:uncharacterized protein n=1 Tax=Eucyclogobius newberryi TaxID=166745 RepID=UPI003B58D7AC